MRVVSANPTLCLAADTCSSNFCPLRLVTCGSNDAQRWLMDSNQRLRPLSAATMCLELPSSGAASGTAARLYTCSSGTTSILLGLLAWRNSFNNQRWLVSGEGWLAWGHMARHSMHGGCLWIVLSAPG
jgi:hypothetical protein